MQSRYYDPEVGRFINADAFASTGQGLLGNNMFAYCNNNPINYEDSNGMFTVDATREADVIAVKIKEEYKIGPICYVVIIEAEFNLVEDLTFDWCDYNISAGSSGVLITNPHGVKKYFEYCSSYQNLKSVEIPVAPNIDNAFLILSEEGVGFGSKYEQGIQTYTVTIYPRAFVKTHDLSTQIPAPPVGAGGYSNFGHSSGGGFMLPMRNQTLLFM